VGAAVEALIRKWREDPGGTYRSWFLWEERLNNFRSIRRGIQQVVDEIENGTCGQRQRSPHRHRHRRGIGSGRRSGSGDHARQDLTYQRRLACGDAARART